MGRAGRQEQSLSDIKGNERGNGHRGPRSLRESSIKQRESSKRRKCNKVSECRSARKTPKTCLVDLALEVLSVRGEGCFSDDDLNMNVFRGRRG